MARDGKSAELTRLRALLDRYEAPLMRYATRLTGDAERARDVVRDAFVRLVEKGDWRSLAANGDEAAADDSSAPEGNVAAGASRGRQNDRLKTGPTDVAAGPRTGRSASDDHLAAWLFTVCRNRALELRRKETRMRQLTDDLAESRVGDVALPAAVLELAESGGRVLSLLAALPDNQQEALRLKFQGGLRYREIAEVLDLSVSNVGFLIHTGLKAIREQMGGEA